MSKEERIWKIYDGLFKRKEERILESSREKKMQRVSENCWIEIEKGDSREGPGHWAIYYTRPQNLITTFSNSLA